MDVRCDRCETEYELDDAIVTDAGTSVQCTTCGHTFIVTRRPTSPLSQMRVTPSPAAAAPTTGPDVPEWTLSTDDGKIHRFRDLNTLQKWIVERKVTRTDKISRAGGPWLAVGEVIELGPFFSVVDEADRARADGGAARRSGVSPARGAGDPSQISPFTSSAGERPISEDGPTVPNRRLPEIADVGMSSAGGPSASSADQQSRESAPEGVRQRGADGRGLAPVASPAKAARADAPQSSSRPNPRDELVLGTETTEELGALESESLRPSRRGRNMVLGLLGAAAVVGGGYWWSSQQHATAPGVPAPAPPVAAAPAPPGGAPSAPTVAAASEPARGPVGAANPAADDKAAVGAAPEAKPNPPSSAGTTAPTHPTVVAADAPGVQPPAGAPSVAAHGAAGPGDAAHVVGARGDARAAGSYDQIVAEADRLLERGKSAQADKLYAKALALRPDGASALTGAAYVLLDRQRHFRAIETFRRALAIQPTYGPALFGIAESYRARGDSAQALGAYRQYLAIDPSGTDAPAARRQIKDLEAAAPAERAAHDAPAGGTDDR